MQVDPDHQPGPRFAESWRISQTSGDFAYPADREGGNPTEFTGDLARSGQTEAAIVIRACWPAGGRDEEIELGIGVSRGIFFAAANEHFVQ